MKGEAMLIQEVENVVGLSKKSIRYYEDEGLLNPKRNDNKYREYTMEDLKKLKTIKFLRELDVPIRELKLLNEGHLTLNECMKERIEKISNLENNFQKIKLLCENIINNQETFANIDIDNYFQTIRIMNKKEGFTMNKEKSNKAKKIGGAILASAIFDAFFIFLISILVYFQIVTDEKCPLILFIILIFILITPVIITIGNLIARIREILGGEEDEASKY